MFEKFIKLISGGKDETKSSIFEPSESCAKLLSIIASIRSSLDIDETFRIIIDEILKILDVPSVSISEYTDKESSSSFKIRTWRSERPMPEPCELDHSGPQYIAENLFKNGKIFLESDIESSDYPECVKNNFRVIGVKACVCVPVKKGSDIWGFISVSDYKQRNWEKFEAAFLEAIADQIYEAVKQAQMYSDLKEQKNKESALKKITEIITKSLDTEHFLYEVCREIAKLFDVQRVSIGDYTGKFREKGTLVAEYRSDENITSIGADTQIKNETAEFWNKYVIERGEVFSVDNFEESDIADDIKKIYKEMGVISFIGVPLKEQDKSWGGLFLSDYNSVRHWSDSDKNLLSAVSDQVYMAVRQVELYTKTKKQAEGERLLRRITDTIRSSLDINEITVRFVTEVGKAFGAERCFIGKFDIANQCFLPIDKQSEYLSSSEIRSVVGCTFSDVIEQYFKFVYKENVPIVIPDLEALIKSMPKKNEALINMQKEFNVKSTYGFPVASEDKVIGLFVVHYTEQKVFLSPSDIELMRIISLQLGIAIKQANLYALTKRQAQREALLRKINETIRSSLDIEDVKNEIVREIGKTFKTDRCFIRLYDESGSLLPVDIEYLGHKNAKSMKGGLFTKYLDEHFKKIYFMNKIISAFDKEVFSGDNLVNKDLKELFETYNINTSYGIPIFHGDKPLGSIVLQWSEKVTLSDEELDLLKQVANQAATAINQADLYTKATQANKLKSDFIAAMSHEFRTPLNAIIGFSEMLLTDDYGKLNEKQSKFLNNIELSGKNLLHLVNEILDISKIESGNAELNIEKIDSGKIIEESFGSLKCLADQKNIKIELKCDEIYVFADSGKFRQILNNILSNAVKFTPEGGKIKISSTIEKSHLTVEVEDTGIGIASEEKENVFSEFKQVSYYQGHKEGTGLGLALTKKLVELHNGRIDFESEKGKGSKFWFILPKAAKIPLNKKKK